MKTAFGPLCLALLLCGCPEKPPVYPLDGGLSTEEQEVTDRAGRGSNAVQMFADVADSVFNFDPTLDPTKDETQNAAAIQAQAMTSLNGCGSATLNGTTVTVDFGAMCTLKNGSIASGSIAVGVAKNGSMITLTVTMTMLKVNGASLDGSLTMTTSNATTFTTIGSLTTADGTYNSNLTLNGTATSIGISGTLQEAMGTTKANYTYTFVVWNRADCYPNSGSVKIQRGSVMSTITFDAETAATGKVSVATGRVTVPGHLPAYGSCPMM
ncbi:MAG: hypothetical protein QM723_39535 [Myxococcaceae bacterium]